MANENASEPKSHLLSLPPELRFMIYEYINSDSPGLRKYIMRDVVVSIRRLNARALGFRMVCSDIRAEATDYFFAKSQILFRIGGSSCPDEIQGDPSLEFLAIAQDMQLTVYLDCGHPFEGRLSLLEKVLLQLKGSQSLRKITVQITVNASHGTEDNGRQRKRQIYTSLTKCHMMITREGHRKGSSATQMEVEFGLKAAQKLRKLQASDWMFEEDDVTAG